MDCEPGRVHRRKTYAAPSRSRRPREEIAARGDLSLSLSVKRIYLKHRMPRGDVVLICTIREQKREGREERGLLSLNDRAKRTSSLSLSLSLHADHAGIRADWIRGTALEGSARSIEIRSYPRLQPPQDPSRGARRTTTTITTPPPSPLAGEILLVALRTQFGNSPVSSVEDFLVHA